MQGYRSAACKFAGVLDRECSVSGRLPLRCLVFPRAPSHKNHAIGDHECGVEAHSELADQRGQHIGRLSVANALEQLARAGFRDGSDVGDNLIAAHTDAVVADHQRPGCGITLDPNLELLIRPDEIGPAQRLEPKPVERVRRVRNKFSKKYFFVRIERMNHQVENLTSFRLKFKSAHVCCHGKSVTSGSEPFKLGGRNSAAALEYLAYQLN